MREWVGRRAGCRAFLMATRRTQLPYSWAQVVVQVCACGSEARRGKWAGRQAGGGSSAERGRSVDASRHRQPAVRLR